uniref:Phage virion morphogenesis protein n=1 Tax=Cereibacter sphaeroides (strain ATCC 17025 / ATH 2.4.3) TaxID=349102 RepID=A4WS38_CERS5
MIRVELKQDQVTVGLEALARQLDDLTPVMQEIGAFLVASTKERFQKGETPEGAKWAPKSPTTVAAYARRKVRLDPRPLFGETGMLSSQIAMFAGPASVEVGSNLVYAAVMQFGAGKGAFGADRAGHPIPWGTIPGRPFLGLSPADAQGIRDIVGEWLQTAATPEP